MKIYRSHLILSGSLIREALILLNKLSQDAILFVVNNRGILKGSVTDGDIRRGLLKGFTSESLIDNIIQKNTKYIIKGHIDLQKVIKYREDDYRIIPVVDKNKKIVNIINFRKVKSYLPIDVIIMAGGEGKRLMPLTKNTPKPLLKIGEKTIIEHNLDRLALYGIDDFWISLKYLGKQIENHIGNGKNRNIKINYVTENKPLGTIGSVSKITKFNHDFILIINSDILTNINYEKMFLDFIKNDADFAVVSIPYEVKIPYAVLETENRKIQKLREKPTYTYFSNGGIYFVKKEILKHIPKNKFFNATDLIDKLISKKLKVISLPFSGYWLDIGKHEDFQKAQRDIHNIIF